MFVCYDSFTLSADSCVTTGHHHHCLLILATPSSLVEIANMKNDELFEIREVQIKSCSFKTDGSLQKRP